MSFLKNVVKNGIADGVRKGIGKAVSNAVGDAVNKAVRPAAERYADKAAERINEGAAQLDKSTRELDKSVGEANRSYSKSQGSSPFANLERAAQSYATAVSKNVKVCPGCGEGTTADRKFCPSCGTKLPDTTLADDVRCPQCGTQNTVGTAYCQECGCKLPAKRKEEENNARKDSDVLNKWNRLLPDYPLWEQEGWDYTLKQDGDAVLFTVCFENREAAERAIRAYRNQARREGFTTAGKYPDKLHLYKMVDGTCCHIDTEHCFEGDDYRPTIYFYPQEPEGGFYYDPEKEQQNRKRRSFFPF